MSHLTNKGDQQMARQSNRKPSKKRSAKSNQMAGRLPRNAPPIEVTISHIGGRGDGIAKALYTHNYKETEHIVFVPASLPGERLLVQPLSLTSQGIKARIIELYTPSPNRHKPRCDAFSACGGCRFQHWDETKIGSWKSDLVAKRIEIIPSTTPQMLRVSAENSAFSSYQRRIDEIHIIGHVVWFAGRL